MSDGITDSSRGWTWYMFRACGRCGKEGHYSAVCPTYKTSHGKGSKVKKSIKKSTKKNK